MDDANDRQDTALYRREVRDNLRCLKESFEAYRIKDQEWKDRFEPYLVTAIESAEFWRRTKDENIKNVVKGTVWLTFIAICAALWMLIKDSLSR